MRKLRFKIQLSIGLCSTGSMSYKLYSTQLNKTLNQLPAQFIRHLIVDLGQKWKRDFRYRHSSPLCSHNTIPVAAHRSK